MQRKPLDAFAMLSLSGLCIIWGLQQVAVKAVADAMHPVLQLGLRSLCAALLVLGLMLWRRQGFSLRDGTLLPGVGAGVLFAAEFFFVAIGLQYTTASHMSVFLYTSPIFTVLGLHLFLPSERLRPLQWFGVIAAFSGVAVAFSNGLSVEGENLRHILIGDAFGMLAGFLWGATTVLIRCSALSEAPPATTLLYQLCAGGVLLLAAALPMGAASEIEFTGMLWLSLVFQSVVVAFLSYLAWFWMLRHYLASRVTVFSFLTPLFGVLFGVLLLNEPLDLRFGIGATLVMLGVVVVNAPRLGK